MPSLECQHLDKAADRPNPAGVSCPYCGGPLRWTPLGWLTRGLFECPRCGDFPDFSRRADPTSSSPTS